MASKQNQILYLTYDGLSDPLGQSQILPYLNGLAEKGWILNVVSFEKKKHNQELHENISWFPLKYHKDPPVISTLFDIRNLYKLAKTIVKEREVQIVHCRSYVTSLVGLRLKREYGVKFIFDMRGFWPDEKLESGNWDSILFRPVYDYFKRKERDFIMKADQIISLTMAGKNHLLQHFDVRKDKIRVIPTCIDLSRFQRADDISRDTIRRELGLGIDDHVFVYSGSLGGNYPTKLLIDYYHKISVNFKRSRLMVLSNQCQLLNRNPDVISFSVDNVEIPVHLSACDTGIIFYKNGFSNIGRCPTKYAEYLACGLNVVYPEPYGDLVSYDHSKTKENFSLIKGVDEYNKAYCNLVNQRVNIVK